MVTAKLRQFLQTKMTAIVPGAHYGVASASATFPYLVYNLEELAYEDGVSLQELEVDVVDYGEDTAPAEQLADELQTAFDHLHELTDDFLVAIYRERRQPLYEDDKSVIRRRLTFQVRLHERS